MQAVEEEVERLSNENSLLLHRMSQLVASHQQVDAENQQLRHELQCSSASQVVRPLHLLTYMYHRHLACLLAARIALGLREGDKSGHMCSSLHAWAACSATHSCRARMVMHS